MSVDMKNLNHSSANFSLRWGGNPVGILCL